MVNSITLRRELLIIKVDFFVSRGDKKDPRKTDSFIGLLQVKYRLYILLSKIVLFSLRYLDKNKRRYPI